MTHRRAAAVTAHDDLLEALRASEERLRLVVTNAPVVFWAFDRDGIFTFLEGRGLAALGPNAGARVGESVFDVYGSSASAVRNSRRVLAGEEFTDVQEIDGVFFETHFVPLRDARGSVIGAMGVSTDITERRRAEEELREREKRFENVFRMSPAAIALNRADDGRYVDVNDRFVDLVGRPREEILGATPDALGLWMRPAELEPILETLRRDGQVTDRQIEIHSRRTGSRIVLFSAARIEVRGEPCVLSFLHDVTDRRRAEDALLEVSGRLLRSQDEERRRIARELHDSTAQTLAGAALGLAAVAADPCDLGGPARRALSEAMALIDEAARQVRTLSYLLHPPMLDEVGLGGALREFVGGFSQRSGIAVTLDVSDALERLPREVELTLFRIVQECLANVHRHSGSRSATITLAPDPEGIRLEVRDEGRGVVPPGSTVEAVSRLGVGIPGMRERVRQLGGRLEIDSTRGTVVRAIVPRDGSTGRAPGVK